LPSTRPCRAVSRPTTFIASSSPCPASSDHHQQVEDGRQFVQDGLSPLLSEALDHMVRQQVAGQCTAQQGRDSPSRIKVSNHQTGEDCQRHRGDARRAIERELLGLVEAGPGQGDVDLSEPGRVLIGAGSFPDPPCEQCSRYAAPLKR
jgi:hypothetical protein